MKKLFDIQQELLELFDEIEEQGGEITDEQIKRLAIGKNELKTKLETYYKAIKSWEADEQLCKEEKKRINDVQNKYKNRITRLKSTIINTVNLFGDNGKNNKYIELPTIRFSTKNSSSIELNIQRIDIFISEIEERIRELYNAGILVYNDDIDLTDFLKVINANIKAKYGEGFEEFTLLDLEAINIEISIKSTINDLFKSKGEALTLYCSHPTDTIFDYAESTAKQDIKNVLDKYKDVNTNITIAKQVNNQSLLIK